MVPRGPLVRGLKLVTEALGLLTGIRDGSRVAILPPAADAVPSRELGMLNGDLSALQRMGYARRYVMLNTCQLGRLGPTKPLKLRA